MFAQGNTPPITRYSRPTPDRTKPNPTQDLLESLRRLRLNFENLPEELQKRAVRHVTFGQGPEINQLLSEFEQNQTPTIQAGNAEMTNVTPSVHSAAPDENARLMLRPEPEAPTFDRRRDQIARLVQGGTGLGAMLAALFDNPVLAETFVGGAQGATNVRGQQADDYANQMFTWQKALENVLDYNQRASYNNARLSQIDRQYELEKAQHEMERREAAVELQKAEIELDRLKRRLGPRANWDPLDRAEIEKAEREVDRLEAIVETEKGRPALIQAQTEAATELSNQRRDRYSNPSRYRSAGGPTSQADGEDKIDRAEREYLQEQIRDINEKYKGPLGGVNPKLQDQYEAEVKPYREKLTRVQKRIDDRMGLSEPSPTDLMARYINQLDGDVKSRIEKPLDSLLTQIASAQDGKEEQAWQYTKQRLAHMVTNRQISEEEAHVIADILDLARLQLQQETESVY